MHGVEQGPAGEGRAPHGFGETLALGGRTLSLAGLVDGIGDACVPTEDVDQPGLSDPPATTQQPINLDSSKFCQPKSLEC